MIFSPLVAATTSYKQLGPDADISSARFPYFLRNK